MLKNRQRDIASTPLWLVDGWLKHTGMVGCFIIPDTTFIVAFPTVGTRAVNGVNDDVHGVLNSGHFKQVPGLWPVQEKPLYLFSYSTFCATLRLTEEIGAVWLQP